MYFLMYVSNLFMHPQKLTNPTIVWDIFCYLTMVIQPISLPPPVNHALNANSPTNNYPHIENCADGIMIDSSTPTRGPIPQFPIPYWKERNGIKSTGCPITLVSIEVNLQNLFVTIPRGEWMSENDLSKVRLEQGTVQRQIIP